MMHLKTFATRDDSFATHDNSFRAATVRERLSGLPEQPLTDVRGSEGLFVGGKGFGGAN